MNLAWLTDIHLLPEKDRCLFYRTLLHPDIDGLMISGDIAEATTISSILFEMAHHIMKPIYFVLGNNDHYYNYISHTRQNLHGQTLTHPLIHWLPITGPIKLNQSTVLLGEDTWPDGRLDDFYNSKFCDPMKIVDLQEARKKGKTHLLELIQKLAFEDAKQLVHQIHKAAENLHSHNIIILIHVPPFKENARHQGKLCEPTHLPLFLSKVTGDMIRRCASKYPHIDFQVLYGHTQSIILQASLEYDCQSRIIRSWQTPYSRHYVH